MVKYVKDFEHPSSFGFSGSSRDRVVVKGYVRGGRVSSKAALPPVKTAPAPAPVGPAAPPRGALSTYLPKK